MVWESKGWLSSIYYSVKINPIKKLFGFMINRLVELRWKRMQKSKNDRQGNRRDCISYIAYCLYIIERNLQGSLL